MAGVKLKMPLRSVAYQVLGSTVALTSKARVVRPGEELRLLQVVDAVGEDAGGDEDQQDPGVAEELPEVDLHRAAIDEPAEQHRLPRPITQPMSGWLLPCPAASVVA